MFRAVSEEEIRHMEPPIALRKKGKQLSNGLDVESSDIELRTIF